MNDVLEHLVSVLSEERDKIGNFLLNNSASDFAQYQFLCGQARGLLAAQYIIEDLASQMEQNDD